MQDDVSNNVASVGLAINDNGDITGISFDALGPRAFVRPSGGNMLDLNSLIPADSELHLFSACSIKSREEIIGLAFDAQGNFHGYLATPSNGAGDSSDASFAAIRSSRFEYARKLLRDRFGSFGAGPVRQR